MTKTASKCLRHQGDFVVLSIQAGRLLLKIVGNKIAGNVPKDALESSVRHLYAFNPEEVPSPHEATKEELQCPLWLVRLFEQR